MANVSVIERAQFQTENGIEYGYRLVKRNGKPARAFNDPANGWKAPKLIAHDWHQHGFQEVENGHWDELVAIGAQYYSVPEFIEEQGGLDSFIAYQLQALAKEVDEWSFHFDYKVQDKECQRIIDSYWKQIVYATNQYLENDFFFFLRVMTGATDLLPLHTSDTFVRDAVCKAFTKGYHYAQRVYKNREAANRLYNKIVDQLTPYVSKVDENSPERLYLYVKIHEEQVEVRA